MVKLHSLASCCCALLFLWLSVLSSGLLAVGLSSLSGQDLQTEYWDKSPKAIPDESHAEKEEKKGLFLAACETGNVANVKNLIGQGIDPLDRYWGLSGLEVAIIYGHGDVAMVLIEEQALEDDSLNHEFLLKVAAEKGLKGVVKSLLDRGTAKPAERQQQEQSPLYLAAMGGHSEIVDMLLGAGVDPNKVDGCGWPPLYIAIKNAHVEVVRSLLSGGAHVPSTPVCIWTRPWVRMYEEFLVPPIKKDPLNIALDTKAECKVEKKRQAYDAIIELLINAKGKPNHITPVDRFMAFFLRRNFKEVNGIVTGTQHQDIPLLLPCTSK